MSEEQPLLSRRTAPVSRRDLESFAFEDRVLDTEVRRRIEVDPALVAEAESLREDREAFLAEMPADPFVSRVLGSAGVLEHRTVRRRWIVSSLAAAAAVTAVLVSLPRAEGPPGGIQLKGEPPSLVVHRSRGGGSAAPFEGPLHAGDVLRFSVLAGEPAHVALFDVDRRGAVATWVASTPVTATRSALPGSIVLDGELGPELLILAVSHQPIDPASLGAWLRVEVRGANGDPRTLMEHLEAKAGPPGIRFVLRLLEKEPEPK